MDGFWIAIMFSAFALAPSVIIVFVVLLLTAGMGTFHARKLEALAKALQATRTPPGKHFGIAILPPNSMRLWMGNRSTSITFRDPGGRANSSS